MSELAKELLNQPLLKHFHLSGNELIESYAKKMERWTQEAKEFMESLVDEFEKDMNPTTAANLCLQLLLIGNTEMHRDNMIEAMQRAMRLPGAKEVILPQFEWVIWARAVRKYVFDKGDEERMARREGGNQ